MPDDVPPGRRRSYCFWYDPAVSEMVQLVVVPVVLSVCTSVPEAFSVAVFPSEESAKV